MDLRLKPLVLQLLSNRFRVLRRFPNARTRLDVQGLAARSFPSRLADRQTADRTFKGQRRHFAPERLPGPVGPQLLLARLSSAGAGAPPASHGVPRASARPFRAANNPRSHCAATEAARGDARRGSRAERTGRRPWTPTCGPTPKRSPRGAGSRRQSQGTTLQRSAKLSFLHPARDMGETVHRRDGRGSIQLQAQCPHLLVADLCGGSGLRATWVCKLFCSIVHVSTSLAVVPSPSTS